MRDSLSIVDLHQNRLPVYTVDFESYYENNRKGYSLTNPDITATTYIRDPRFRAHGAGVVDPDGFSYWVTHDDLQCFFDSINWSKNAFLAMNTQFDGLIAHEYYGVKAAYYLDIMFMSYGEWSVNESGSLAAITKRLGLEGKIKGSLEETSGVRFLTCKQERALVPYAIQDAEQCRKAFEILYFDRKYPEDELHLIDTTLKMYVNPELLINAGLCRAEIELEETRIKNLLNSDLIKEAVLSKKCKSILGTDGVKGLIRSPNCFAELLQSRGIVPPKKHAKDKDGEFKYDEVGNPVYTYAFAKTDIELQALADDSRVSDLVAARLGVKSTIRIDRANRFLAASDNGTKPIPIPLRYCGAHTTRWSGMDSINYQNLPSGRDGRGSRLREATMAPPGYVLVAVDSGQIEARCNAWLWGQEDLLDVFRNKGDPYSELASEMYGVPVAKKGPYSYYRPVGKAMELGLGFGMGFERFLNGCLSGSIIGEVIDMTPEKAEYSVSFWRNKRNMIVEGWGILQTAINLMAAKEAGYHVGPLYIDNDRIVLPNELSLHYKNVHWRKVEDKKRGGYKWEIVFQSGKSRTGEPTWTRTWGSSLDENIIQALARTIVGEQALEIAKRYKIVLLVHDEIVYLAPEEEAEEALAFGLKIMRTPREWCPDIPLDAEGSYGRYYSK